MLVDARPDGDRSCTGPRGFVHVDCRHRIVVDGVKQVHPAPELDGVVAVLSLSKRSNLAGVRVGFYVGDAELVAYLQEIRKHVGMMVPGPAQAAAVVALDDDDHVELQRTRYRGRLELLASVLSEWSGEPVPVIGESAASLTSRS